MEVIPARTAAVMEEAPWAWAAEGSPSISATSMAARISASVNFCTPGRSPADMMPPLAQSLMQSTWLRAISRASRRISSGELAMRVSDRCSPVIAEEGRIEEDFRLGAKRLTELGREGRLQPLDPLILDSIVLGTLNQLLCLHFAGYLMLDRGVLEAALSACWRAISLA